MYRWVRAERPDLCPPPATCAGRGRPLFRQPGPGAGPDVRGAVPGPRTSGSYAAAAPDPRVEALYLCTPHHLHRAHVALAAQAGKHILVEKPLALTLAEGRTMIAAAQRAGVTLMVAENA